MKILYHSTTLPPLGQKFGLKFSNRLPYDGKFITSSIGQISGSSIVQAIKS